MGSGLEWEGPAVLSCLLVVGVALLSFLLLHHQRPKLRLPPSPPALPLLGHFLHVKKLTNAVFLQHLRDTLGPIFTLHVGKTPIIYITSAALAHEALVQRSLAFAARPQFPSRALFSNNFRSINAASYGPFWRILRRNLVHEMLTMPKIFSFKPARTLVIDRMVSRVRSEAIRNEGVVSVYTNVRTAMLELLLFMCFGFHLPEDAIFQIACLVDEILHLPTRAMQDFYPFTRIFYMKQSQRVLQLRAKQVQIYISLIEKHKEQHKLGKITPGSYLETLLHMDASMPLSMEDLVTLCSEFIVAGTDTTVTTLEWTMAYLVDNVSVQSKLYVDITATVGDRLVEEMDLQQLPYLQAVVRETLRLNPPGHFLLPHAVSELCKVGGYDVPLNAVVLFHVISIGRDHELWDEPLKFKPERFLGNDCDITGTKNLMMVPFGAGRRICPGLGLASMHLELFVARLVQAFEWTNFPAGEIVDLTERTVFTVRMKHPLKASIRERELY